MIYNGWMRDEASPLQRHVWLGRKTKDRTKKCLLKWPYGLMGYGGLEMIEGLLGLLLGCGHSGGYLKSSILSLECALLKPSQSRIWGAKIAPVCLRLCGCEDTLRDITTQDQ
jgi:hypothetical protein